MKYTLSKREAVNMLLDDDYANWTREGAEALVEYLEELEEETGEAIEFCAVAIRCDYSEYVTAWEACDDLDLEVTGETEDCNREAIDRLQKAGVLVAELPSGGVVVRD